MSERFVVHSDEGPVPAEASPHWPRWLVSPLVVHLVSLAAAAVWILYCERGQWFFFDDWAFIAPSNDGNLFAPHVGHWSTSPMLIMQGLRNAFGLNSYLPFVLIVVFLHLVGAHLLWRVLNRCRVMSWVSILTAFLFAVLGAGAANILWAFQMGFVGAIVLALIVVLLLDDERRSLPAGQTTAVIVVSIVSVTFSGTAIPVLVAGGIASWRRRGLGRSILLLLPAACAYLVWYLFLGRAFAQKTGLKASGFEDLFVGVPGFMGHFVVDNLQSLTPIPLLGILLFGVLVLVPVRHAKALWRSAPLSLALLSALVVMAGLTAYSRLETGDAGAASDRYAYVVILLALPLFAVAATRLTQGKTAGIVLVCGLIAVTAVYNAALLKQTSNIDANRNQHSRHVISAAVTLLQERPEATFGSAHPLPKWGPDLTVADLKIMVSRGWLTAGAFSEDDRLTAMLNMGILETHKTHGTGDCQVATGSARLPTNSILEVGTATTLTLTVASGDHSSDNREFTVPDRKTLLTSRVPKSVHVAIPSGVSVRICGG